MRFSEISEEASAGATSAGAVAAVVNPIPAKAKPKKKGRYGAPKAKQKTNADGTAKNALDIDNNLFGNGAVKR